MPRNTDHSTDESRNNPQNRLYKYASVIRSTRNDPINDIPEGQIWFEPGIKHNGSDYEVLTEDSGYLTISSETVAIVLLPDVMQSAEAVKAARNRATELTVAIDGGHADINPKELANVK